MRLVAAAVAEAAAGGAAAGGGGWTRAFCGSAEWHVPALFPTVAKSGQYKSAQYKPAQHEQTKRESPFDWYASWRKQSATIWESSDPRASQYRIAPEHRYTPQYGFATERCITP